MPAAPRSSRAPKGVKPTAQVALPLVPTPALPAELTLPLTPETFAGVVALVARRRTDPAAQARLETDPVLQPAWAALVSTYDEVIGTMNRQANHISQAPERFRREPLVRSPRYAAKYAHRPSRHDVPPVKADTLALPLALGLGELRRVATLPAEARFADRASTCALDPRLAARFEEDAGLVEAIAPVLVVLGDHLFADRVEVETDHLGRPAPEVPLALLAEAVAHLGVLQADLMPKGAPKEQRQWARYHIGTSRAATLAAELSAKHVLATPNLADALELAYGQHWHTHPKGKVPTGAWIAAVRQRAIKEATPELLTVMAASSDGQNRAAAGIAAHTPDRVYKAMLGDNSLGVLEHVVQSPKFGQEEAYAMMKTDLPNQIVAVMRYATVDMGIRVLACERAIRHPKVDPNHVYHFLSAHRSHGDVPESLWHTFIMELRHKLQWIRQHGDADQAARFEERVLRFARSFVEDMLRPYWNAVKLAKRYEKAPPRYYSARKEHQDALRFLRANEFIRDADLLNIVLEGIKGAKESKDLVDLCTTCHESDIPLTQEMMLALFMHQDAAVREAAVLLCPNIRPEDIPGIADEVRAKVAAELALVRDEVEALVIPDFDESEFVLTARRVSANHHYFMAAKEFTRDELETAFVTCAQRDPRTIPDEFRRMIEARSFATTPPSSLGRVAALVEDATEAPAGLVAAGHVVPQAPTPVLLALEQLDGMVQGDLFGAPRPTAAGDAAAPPTAPAAPRRPAAR